MKLSSLFGHLCVPAVVAIAGFAVSLRHEPLGLSMFSTYVIGGYLFYAAPHLLWTGFATLVRLSGPMWHSGFIASSIALAAIASLWLGPRDPSGLPLQWMLYWPLAIVLQLVIAGGTAIYQRSKKTPNPSVNTDAAR